MSVVGEQRRQHERWALARARLMASTPSLKPAIERREPVVEAPAPVDVDNPPNDDAWRPIIEDVCRKHGCTLGELYGGQRSAWLVRARHEAFFRLSKETTLSLPQIGHLMGSKDHTTVLHGARRHAELLRREERYAAELSVARRAIAVKPRSRENP